MTRISFTENTMHVHLTGLDVALAVKSHLEIPLAHITSVIINAEEVRTTFKSLFAGVRFGTHIPGILMAGTFYQQGEKNFWDIHHPERAMIISLKDEQYHKLVLEVEDPQEVARIIETHLHV